jgi:hypothetical protein
MKKFVGTVIEMRDKVLDAISYKMVYIDWDGVAAEKAVNKGSQDWSEISGPLRKGTVEAIQFLVKTGHRVVILTARENLKPVKDVINQSDLRGWIHRVTNIKGPGDLYVDDRAYRFNGSWFLSLWSIYRHLAYHKNPKRIYIVGIIEDVIGFLRVKFKGRKSHG